MSQSKLTRPMAVKDALESAGLYTRCYCEENVYHLIHWLLERNASPLSSLQVVFISNDAKTVPFWNQRGSKSVTVWDYHVVLVDVERGQLWDLDSALPCPVNVNHYVRHTLHPEHILPTRFQRMYRLIAAEDYLRGFASDRGHMRKEDGSWQSPPPSYQCIKNKKGESNTLGHYWTMKKVDCDSEKGLYGRVMDESSFLLQLRYLQKID